MRDLEQAVSARPGLRPRVGSARGRVPPGCPVADGSPADTWRKAQAAARQALALDSTSAEAYTSLAYGNAIYAWNWTAAGGELPSGHRRGPQLRHRASMVRRLLGRARAPDQAQAEIGRAHRLDPLALQIGVEWGWIPYLMHRYDVATARIHQILELDPNYGQAHYRLGLVLIQQHRYPDAIATLKRSLDLGVFQPQGAAALAVAEAASGNRAGGLTIVHDLERRRSGTELVPPVQIAEVYAGLGDVTRGLDWLNRGIDEKDIYIPENFFDPLLDPLRSDPRFEQVLRRMDLAQPARDSSVAPAK